MPIFHPKKTGLSVDQYGHFSTAIDVTQLDVRNVRVSFLSVRASPNGHLPSQDKILSMGSSPLSCHTAGPSVALAFCLTLHGHLTTAILRHKDEPLVGSALLRRLYGHFAVAI